MPITQHTLLATPYKSGKTSNGINLRSHPAPVGHTGPVMYRHEHIHYPANDVRINYALTPGTLAMPQTVVDGPYNVNGNGFFLPYDNNYITSMRLPSPPPGGVDLFWTANLSGCRFFVDRINGSTDLMVYHANTLQFGSPPTADVDFQSVNASNFLDQMLINARNDLAPLVLNGAASCVKRTYFASCGRLERTLAFGGYQFEDMNLPGRPRDTPVGFAGCMVVGLVGGAGWEFWWQCWGHVNYKEPDQIQHRRIRPDVRHPGAVHQSPVTVLGTGQIL